MDLTLYGIPTCGTVRKARAWLDARGVDHTFVDLRQDPPTRDRVAGWAAALGAKALRNTSGGAYRALPAEKADWDDTTWIDHFAADPMLIKRPVVERNGVPVQVGFRGTDDEIAARLLG